MDFKSLKILVVDDDPGSRELLHKALRSWGHEPRLAASGEEAVANVAMEVPDMILMDVKMDGMSGHEATRRIRTLTGEKWIPIIFQSALITGHDMLAGMMAGGDEYLPKPVDLYQLKAKIGSFIRIAATQQNTEDKAARLNERRLGTELRAAQMERRLNLAVDAASIGFWDWDLASNAAHASTNFFSMLGEIPDIGAINGKQLLRRLHSHDRKLMVRRIRLALTAPDASYQQEARMRHADGTFRWVHVVGRVLAPDEDRKATRLMGVTIDITERVRAATALRENAQQLRLLSRRVLEAQETERRRIAHELHDELGQSLTAIKINLQAHKSLLNRSPDEVNNENLRIIDAAMQHLRELALALRPTVLDDLGLLPALSGIAEQMATRSGFKVHFYCAIADSRLSPDVETAVFRIAQEAFTNIARHARAKNVHIDLYHEGDELMLGMRDDGVGFDVAAMRARATCGGSIGVLGMQERAMLIGGQLAIESSRGSGTAIRMRCAWRPHMDAP
jgi:two-component system sensor histidine kinase UhpB